ncbi:MAG: nitrate- and nitrite sensing domain-containing protein [Thalassotalea sp.]|nr:nitrate- and nitrite sensing domain-containing protein [Thalassotalea sp.]
MTIAFIVRGVSTSIGEASQAKQDQQLVLVLDVLEKIAHNHAVERGLSAGYLGSPSDDRLSKVRTQRQKADTSVQNLKQLEQQEVIDGINDNVSSTNELVENSLTAEHTSNALKEHANKLENMATTLSAAA